jgi:hypothetical protein
MLGGYASQHQSNLFKIFFKIAEFLSLILWRDFLLPRFALNTKPRKVLNVLRCNTFKTFLVDRLVGNCCN